MNETKALHILSETTGPHFPKLNMNASHQINESHLGTNATPEDARFVADFLTENGCPSEYNPAQGVSSRVTDPESGEQIEIPETLWQSALASIA